MNDEEKEEFLKKWRENFSRWGVHPVVLKEIEDNTFVEETDER